MPKAAAAPEPEVRAAIDTRNAVCGTGTGNIIDVSLRRQVYAAASSLGGFERSSVLVGENLRKELKLCPMPSGVRRRSTTKQTPVWFLLFSLACVVHDVLYA